MTLEDKCAQIDEEVDFLIRRAATMMPELAIIIRDIADRVDRYLVSTEGQTSTLIHCDAIIERAKFWADKAVPYSQSAYYAGPDGGLKYRTDCSGYVSMAWKLPTSMTTRTLGGVSTPIAKDDLQRGDILLKAAPAPLGHTFVFDKWVNETTKTQFYAYETYAPKGAHYRLMTKYPYKGTVETGYEPRRFKNVTCD